MRLAVTRDSVVIWPRNISHIATPIGGQFRILDAIFLGVSFGSRDRLINGLRIAFKVAGARQGGSVDPFLQDDPVEVKQRHIGAESYCT